MYNLCPVKMYNLCPVKMYSLCPVKMYSLCPVKILPSVNMCTNKTCSDCYVVTWPNKISPSAGSFQSLSQLQHTTAQFVTITWSFVAHLSCVTGEGVTTILHGPQTLHISNVFTTQEVSCGPVRTACPELSEQRHVSPGVHPTPTSVISPYLTSF